MNESDAECGVSLSQILSLSARMHTDYQSRDTTYSGHLQPDCTSTNDDNLGCLCKVLLRLDQVSVIRLLCRPSLWSHRSGLLTSRSNDSFLPKLVRSFAGDVDTHNERDFGGSFKRVFKDHRVLPELDDFVSSDKSMLSILGEDGVLGKRSCDPFLPSCLKSENEIEMSVERPTGNDCRSECCDRPEGEA